MHHDALVQYDDAMRTTIDLPEDLHRIATSIARDRSLTLSETVADLLRVALAGQQDAVQLELRHGIPMVHIGRMITSDDVRQLEDE